MISPFIEVPFALLRQNDNIYSTINFRGERGKKTKHNILFLVINVPFSTLEYVEEGAGATLLSLLQNACFSKSSSLLSIPMP